MSSIVVREKVSRRTLYFGVGSFALVLSFALSGCGSEEDSTARDDSPGDGDGAGAAMGDGDAEGDGDSAGGASGDGDGDSAGGVSGDGDDAGGAPGDGDGDGAGGGAGATAGPPELGDGCTVFPPENAWNLDVSGFPVHERSDAYVASVGSDTTMHPDFGTEWEGAPIGIPYVLVDGSEPLQPIVYTAYGDESDSGPFPIPLDAPIEGGEASDGDRHAIAIDTENCVLYEIYSSYPQSDGWEAASGASWDLKEDDHHPEGCTSADAAGLPIFPGLVRYDEVVEDGSISHALRFTVQRSQRAYIFPARHFASSDTDPDLPPMGLRFRMKANYDCSAYSDEVRVICTALKTYGMIMADNGSNWYLSGAPDPRWSDDNLRDLKSIPGAAFEVVETGDTIITDGPDCSL